MSDLVLAIDGGNFKTDLALLDSSGALLAVVRGTGSSAHALGIEGCVEVLDTLLARAVAEAGLASPRRPLAAAGHVLLAGADLPEERAAIEAQIEQRGWSKRLVVDNDTLALLRAGTDRGWGIAVVCGAGINALGRAPDGREVRFLSLGEISGDWGGGLDVGTAALSAAARSADGRGPRTILETAVPAHFGLTGALEVAMAVHRRQVAPRRLSELAPVVLAAAEEDDVAAGLVTRMADEVVALARAALMRLHLNGADPDVVLGGGLLRAVAPSLVDRIGAGIRELAPDARVRVCAHEPIAGAALLALDALGAGERACVRARTELDAAVVDLAAGRAAVTSA